MASQERRLQPRKQPRQVRAERTRQRILAAAAHVFAEQGYAAGTTNRIAEEAGLSIGSLYQYFPNKDAILVELLARHLDTGVEAELPDAHRQRPIRDTVRAMVHTSIAHHEEDPRLLQLMIEQAPRSKELLRRVEEYHRTRIDSLGRLLAEHPEVSVEDVDTAARLIVSTVELVVHQLVAAPDPVDDRRLENELTTMLTRYLTAGPQTDT